ncbi:FAD binding domain-containing protein [Biscogniauxia mediterranea]|nr:FAD binding domain-containing protein [Biscogniauxia mediterranea]
MPEKPNPVDVLVVGAGPVGLVAAYQLAKFGGGGGGGGISVRIIEKHTKSVQDAYGRAITLFPRTLEMLDQLGLVDELLQHGFACRDTAAYDARGREVHGRGWSFLHDMKGTAFDFPLVLRQKYQEEIFRAAMRPLGVEVEAPVELTAVTVDEAAPPGSHRVTALVRDHATGAEHALRCRYLVACDGGRSTVRRLLGIPFEGSATEDRWVRVDGLVRTDLPKPRSYCAIESPTHGNVLWVALDRGRTRIGYAFPPSSGDGELFDEAAAVRGAAEAVRPFSLAFDRVDWWTMYTVAQRVAARFRAGGDCVLLAGDAAHTHSSAAAQGLNTGLHDVVNLAWKLALVLRGAVSAARAPLLLRTYEDERRPHVLRVVRYDRDISRLVSGRLPEGWAGDPDADVNAVLAQLMREAGEFSSGLGIAYEIIPRAGSSSSNPLNVAGSFAGSFAGAAQQVRPGARAPDVTLLRPGTLEPTRLIRETQNTARFHVLCFASDRAPGSSIPADVFRDMENSAPIQGLIARGFLALLTILPNPVPSAYEALDHEPLGRVYFSARDGTTYSRFGIEAGQGAIVVARPDGWIGTMVALGGGAVAEMEAYFGNIFAI